MEPETTTSEVVEEPKVEPKPETKEAKVPKIDSTKSMSQQADNFLKQLPEDKKEEPAPEEKVEEPVKEPEVIEEPEAVVEPEPEELPEWQKYVLEGLPHIQVLGHTTLANGDPGKDKIFNVKSYTELPADFEFASRRDELAFNAALASQEYKANDLVKEYQQKEQDLKVQQWRDADALDVQKDITRLQKEGVLPKFQYESDDPKFDSDPAVKEANDIYALREKINLGYRQQGRNYFISFEDAADKFYAAKARMTPKEEPKPAPVRTEREEVAKKVSAPQSADPGKQRRTMPPGSTMRDVMKAYNAGRI